MQLVRSVVLFHAPPIRLDALFVFSVMSGGELRFVAGFGKGWDKLGGSEMRWYWASGMS